MSTGPSHYREAEALLRKVERLALGDNADQTAAVAIATAAQAYATLALAAATAVAAPVDGAEEGMPPADATAWYQVAGVKPLKGGNA
ncbi:hypothetical protein [Streptomyces sp. NPDC091215]|uniref:hypothetical protein n=1 Tax=Streptomyces sp. NPDC091215 TaxID=3155192 RepID=UPI0034493074